MTDKKNIVFCGQPSSGKTTFLGALSYTVEENDENNSLKFDDSQDNRYFFNKLADSWVNCDPMMRTKVDSQDSIQMALSRDDKNFYVEMPDLSGETWASIWSEHEISKPVHELLSQSSSIAFFIHADQISSPLKLSEENSMLKGSFINEETEKLEDWNAAKHQSTQAVTVDLLIKISSFMSCEKKRVAIILSAWDTNNTMPCPVEFVKIQMPLLYQYLSAKLDFSDVRVYGVSAQGGCLTRQKQDLLEIEEPVQRIKVIEENGNVHNDLTKLLSWLIYE